MTCCKTAYSICTPIPACLKQLIIKTPVISDTVTLRILDKFSRVYYVTKTSDVQGKITVQLQDDTSNPLIPLTADIPIALLNEYAGDFHFMLYDSTASEVKWIISAVQYDALVVRVKNVLPVVDNFTLDPTYADGEIETFNI